MDMDSELPGLPSERLSQLRTGEQHDSVVETVELLLRRMASIRDRSMRPHALHSFLIQLEDVLMVATLELLIQRAEQGNPEARGALVEMGLDPGLVGALPYERVQDLYGLAHEADLPQVASLFLAPRVNRRRLQEAWPENNHISMPLGNRRQAARGSDRYLLDRLLRDRDHRVIKLLLDNPRITERDAVLVAAQRPTTAAVLDCVASHRRWAASYAVRKALAANPYTPEKIAIGLLTTLMVQDLRFIVTSGVLLPEVHRAAEDTLARRLSLQRRGEKGSQEEE